MNPPRCSLAIGAVLLVTLSALACASQRSPSEPAPAVEAGSTLRCDEGLSDPFRALERLEDPEIEAWMRMEGALAKEVLDSLPRVEALTQEYAALELQGVGGPELARTTADGAFFYVRQLESGARLMHRSGPGEPERELFDPGSYRREEGQRYVLNHIQPSWSGGHVVLSLSKDGEELSEMVILDVLAGVLLSERITHTWPSDGGGVHWLPDESGFVYLRYPVSDPSDPGFLHDMEAVLHRLGETGAEPVALLSAAHNPDLGIERHDFPMVSIPTHDSPYAIAEVTGPSAHADLYIARVDALSAGEPQWRKLFAEADAVAQLSIVGEELIVRTAARDPHYELVRLSLAEPSLSAGTSLAKAPEGEVIVDMATRGGEVFFTTQRDGVVASLYRIDPAGDVSRVPVPESFGTLEVDDPARPPGATLDPKRPLIVEGRGWLSPPRRFHLPPEKSALDPRPAAIGPSPKNRSFEDLIVEERVALASDGAEVPLSLIYRRDLARDGRRPTLIFGYGAYGISATPLLFEPFVLWARQGGIVAVAHVRGGGEKGDAWHQGGRIATKPKSWGDLIACTEDLIRNGYTSADNTALWGISAGGLLVGRAMTARPDLFAAVVAEVGLMNPLRLEAGANGDNSAREFGDIDDPEECRALLEMDAYHHIRDGQVYPRTLVTTGINDPRVDPWQPAKFAARLQQAGGVEGESRTLLWVDFEAGHGAAETLERRAAHIARVLAFALDATGG